MTEQTNNGGAQMTGESPSRLDSSAWVAAITSWRQELLSKMPDPQCYPTLWERTQARIDELTRLERAMSDRELAATAEVSEGGTRDSRIETAAQSRPSLH